MGGRHMPSAFVKKLANTATKQYDLYRFNSEDDRPLTKQIAKYWGCPVVRPPRETQRSYRPYPAS